MKYPGEYCLRSGPGTARGLVCGSALLFQTVGYNAFVISIASLSLNRPSQPVSGKACPVRIQ